MMNRHSKKELTRLILTALVLAGGSFYGPAAEAEELEITKAPSSVEYNDYLGQFQDFSMTSYYYLKNNTTPSYTGLKVNSTSLNIGGISGGYIDTNGEGLSGRTVTLKNGNVEYIYGGYGGYHSHANGNLISNNTVSIEGGSFRRVFGGYATSSGEANYNKVKITAGSSVATTTNIGYITGAAADKVRYNSVTISGGTFNGPNYIGGVYAINSNVASPNIMEHNSLNLYGSTTGLENATIAGAFAQTVSGGSSSFTDNNIYIGGSRVYNGSTTATITTAANAWSGSSNNTVKMVKCADSIVLRKVNWSESVPVLKATHGIGFQNGAKLDISNIDIVNSAPGTMTLLEGAWYQGSPDAQTPQSLNSITVTYNGGSQTFDSTTKSKVINDGTPNTPQILTNNVTLKKLVGKTTLSINDAYNKVQYTIAKDKLTAIDLAGWDASNTVALSTTDLENGLTAGSITATGTSFAPSVTAGTSKDILTASAGFFTNTQIATAIAYNPTGGTFADDEDKGVTLSGNIAKGVMASTDGSKLTYYSATRDVTNNIVLGPMDWGTGRTITGTGYTFGNVTGVDATNLAFAFTNDQAGALSSTSNMPLLSGATGLTAGKTVTYKNSGTSHTQAVSYSADNGATLSGTLTGTVSTAANAVNYQASSMNLGSIDLTSWNGTASSALPTGWTKNGAISVGGTFTKPTMAAGTSLDILTATSNYFSDANIDAAIAYQSSGAFSNTVNGVTLSGSRASGVKSTNSGKALTYFAEKNDTNTITLGQMAWGTSRTADSTYDFSGVTSIDASNLTFTGTATAADASTTLLTGATGLDGATYTINPTSNTAVVDAAFTDTNGIAYTGKGNGAVSVDGTDVKFTINGGTVNSINLNGWTGATGMNLLTGWTGNSIDVATGNFAAQTTDKTLFTLTGENRFSGTVTGDRAYTSTGAAFANEDKGVTLAGSRTGGIKVEDDKVTLKYCAESLAANTITLGNMTWGTGRTIGAGYTFAGVGNNGVDATGLSFGFTGTNANTIKANDTMELVKNATNLGAVLTVNGGNHSQGISYTADNGAKLSGTLTGTVSTTANTVNYEVTGKTLTGINLSGWDKDQAAVAVDGSWTNGLAANSINAAGFTAPELTAGQTKEILTTSTNNFFTDSQITGAQKFAPGAVTSNTENNVTFTGTQSKGVKASADGQKLVYAVDNLAVTGISLGNMTVGDGGEVTPRAVTSGFDFSAATTINATNLTFDKPEDVADSTLVTNAAGITTGNTVTGKSHSQAITNAAIGTGGIKVSGTLNGTVSAVAGGVNYTVNNKTISSMDLSGWDTTTENTGLPNNKWTGSNVTVNANNFAADAPTENKTIFTTTTDGFFGNVTGDLAYTSGAAFSETGTEGITLSGTRSGGVKKSDDGSDLNFIAEARTVNNISLGNMTWGTGRAMPATGYTFSVADNGVNATGLSFGFTGTGANTIKATDTMELVTGATGLGAGLTVNGASHNQAVSYTATNGATLSGTLAGMVSTDIGKVKYTVDSKTLTGINLSGWDKDQAAVAVDGSWTKNLAANSINAAGFTAPELTAGQTKEILTTSTNNFFTDSQITGAQKFAPGAVTTDEAQGVTFTGTQSKGVKASADGQKLVYAVDNFAVTGISLGNMTVGDGGVVTPRAVTSGFDFSAATTINATNLTFDKPEDVADSTLVTNAAGITTGNTVTGKSHSQAITNAAMGGGITASGTLHGTVAAATNAVSYTVNDKTISSMDLSGWDGTTTVNGLPNNKWTGSNVAVSTGTFTAPTADKTIFTTDITNFFGDVTGAMAYTSGAAFSETGTEGITLSGTRSGGVKKSDDGSDLNFIAEARTVNNISLGNMTWGTGRAMPATGYTFSVADNGVDATGLKFSFTGDTVNTIGSSTPVWNLVTGATGLDGGLTVKGSPVSQTVSYGINKVANLTGTLTGDVTTANHTVQYKVTGKTLDKVDISNWDGSTVNTALNTSWSKKDSGITVTGSGFTAPTAVGDYNILTATPTGYFTGAQIADNIVYKTGSTFSETASNITLSGTQDRGVKVNDNGTALQYSIGKANINNIKVGNVTYTKGGTLIDKSASLYDYSQLNSNGLDISGFGLSMTDEQKKVAAANDSMTLVKANMTLNDIAAQEAGKSSYTYANTSATSDLTVKGTVTGNVAAANSNVVYTVASNTASALTINSMTWNSGTYARPDSEIAYSTALVNADNITFNGVDTLSKNDTMVLVSNYGDEVNKVRGGIFTLSNGKTGKGHAYYDSTTGNLVYVVDRGVDEEVETKTAIGTKTIIINEQPHQGDVPGGEAEGDGEAKDNETIIKKSHIKKNPDGTGGDTNGGTSEDGDADKNKLDIEESEIDGDATGGQSDTGNTDDNETIIKKKSVIHGDVAGGETLGGHGGSRRNKTTVEESTVEGDVDGGKTGGDGETEENKVVITGSKIGGDVNGGHSGGDGDSSGNEVTVDNSTVDGDVNGGKSDGNGNTKNNKVDIKKGSKIGGSVHGGHSGGSGDSTGNEVTVDGSEVDGNVMGGRTKDGNANNNTVNIDGGSTINGSVYGGYSDTGDASGNNVNIGTGKINGDIYGGYSGGMGSTINNTVTLYGDADVSGSNIIGGSNGSTGNTLNIGKGTESWTGGGQTVKNISSFDTLNFTALPWNSGTPALTIGDGSATDLSNTTVTAQQVAFTGVKTISVGSTMMFLDQSNVAAGKKATNINSGSDFTVGTAMEGTGKLVLDANGNVIYQVETAGVSRQTHNTVMAAEAAVISLNAGNDFILSAREGLARKENIGTDGIAAYAKIGGSSIRQETGSHVNVNTWNGIVALGRKDVQKDSVFEYGAFIEHGLGNFTTHNDNAQRGDGSVDYTGVGLLGKWMNNQGLYVEGSLRVGRIHEKGNNLLRDTVRAYGYDERTTYKGFHLGVGKEFAIKDGNTVEVYGKYFYNHKNGMNFNAGLDEYNLDAVTSQILRVGARYTMKRDRWNYYGDLSYEHELDGRAAGRANGMAIRGADTSGGSVRLELGAKLLANEKSPWTLDLNLTGYAGKKQGLQGGASVKFMF